MKILFAILFCGPIFLAAAFIETPDRDASPKFWGTKLAADGMNVTCPCSDPTLCATITTVPQKEVMVFSVTPDDWKHYDWDHITTVVMFNYYDPQLMCHAHSKGVRVVWLGEFDATLLTNETARLQWVVNHLTFIINNHMDGINLDVEFPLDAKDADLLTTFVQTTTMAFKQALPYSQITFDVAWSPACIDLRCYDYKAIADAVDFVFVMSYDEQSQIHGECIAKANSPYDQTAQGIEAFVKLGIPPSKMVLGVPWYGYDYVCLTLSQPNLKCTIRRVPFRGVNCSDAAGNQKAYRTVLNLLADSPAGVHWSDEYKAPYFEYQSQTGEIHQVWYDDPKSLQLRYDYAKKMGLYGVGPWNGDLLNYTGDPLAQKQTKAMWDAMASFLVP